MQQFETPRNLNFNSKNLISITEVKDLGAFLDSLLSSDKFTQALSSFCNSELSQINKVKHLFDRKIVAVIIETLVMNEINYCSSIWSNKSVGNIDKLKFSSKFLLE